jgi:hypothetical protein
MPSRCDTGVSSTRRTPYDRTAPAKNGDHRSDESPFGSTHVSNQVLRRQGRCSAFVRVRTPSGCNVRLRLQVGEQVGHPGAKVD